MDSPPRVTLVVVLVPRRRGRWSTAPTSPFKCWRTGGMWTWTASPSRHFTPWRTHKRSTGSLLSTVGSRCTLTRCQSENYTLPPHKQHTEGAIIPTTGPVRALMAESKRLNKFTPLWNTPAEHLRAVLMGSEVKDRQRSPRSGRRFIVLELLF